MVVKDYNGRLPTHAAAEAGQSEALRVLVGLGCSIGEKDDKGYTAAHLAARTDQVEALWALRDMGCPTAERDDQGRTVGTSAAHPNAMILSWLAPVNNTGLFVFSINKKRHSAARLLASPVDRMSRAMPCRCHVRCHAGHV